MRKSLKWVALGLCAATLMLSCKKKGASEPIYVDSNAGIKLTLAEGQDNFTLTALTGEVLSIEGTTANAPLTAWTEGTKEFTASQAGATVIIKGNVKALRIAKGSFKSLDLSKAPSTFVTLISTGATIENVDLSGAPNLATLTLRDYEKLTTLDLSKQANLKNVALGRYGETEKQRSLVSVVWPTVHNISSLDLREVGFSVNTANFSNLSNLVIAGNMTMTSDIVFKNSPNLKAVVLQKFAQKSLILENNPSLTSVFFDGGRSDDSEKVIKITGNTALTDLTLQMTSNWSNHDKITSIDLSNNPKLVNLKTTDSGHYSLFKSAALRSVDLSGTAIEPTLLLTIVNLLPEGDRSTRKIKLTNPSQEVKNAVLAKGWLLQ